jgi:hypothetical protein
MRHTWLSPFFDDLQKEKMMTVEQVLRNPQTSDWLRTALTAALVCDPIDAANDADVLRALLMRRVESVPNVSAETADGCPERRMSSDRVAR